MKNYILAFAAFIILSTQSSCKKETVSVLFCQVTSWAFGPQSFTFTYDEAGFVKRTTLATGDYYDYTQTGNKVVRQSYTSTGIAVGSPVTYTVNSAGYFIVTPNSSDTTYISYDSEGHLTEYTRRNDTVITRTVYTYQDGDALTAIEYYGDSSIKTTNVYEYYTERENHSNLHILFDLLDNRFGKPTKHFLKSVTKSSSGTISTTNFSYAFDEEGNATSLKVVTQPDNSVNDILFTYHCK